MPITSNQDLYTCVRELATALRDADGKDIADALADALSISSLPGEILGEVRSALQRIRQHELYGRTDIRRRVDEGIAYVDRVLGGG